MIEIRSTQNEGADRCAVGFLAMRGVHAATSAALAHEKASVESALRAAYASIDRAALKALPPMDAYVEYYKKFGYSYHVLGQFTSVAQGKEIPNALLPVTAMFMAELKNMILTAGHDLDKIDGALTIARADGSETYESMGGKTATAVPGDTFVRDRTAIISSVLRGPDRRTAIAPGTDRVLYSSSGTWTTSPGIRACTPSRRPWKAD
jgi:DNA/RNA-binding domain of Phe-tRNA-synthetase-like protein